MPDVGVGLSFSGAFKAAVTFEKNLSDQELEKIKIRPRISNAINPALSRKQVTGDQVLANVRRTLDSMELKRSTDQKAFHEQMIRACLPHIYGPELDTQLDRILKENGWEDLQEQVMIVTPRRWGKTYSVAMFVIALAWCCRSIEQAIFSTGRRASQKLLELIYKLITRIPGARECIPKYNVETLWVLGPGGPEDVRKIFSYPSKVKIRSLSLVLGGRVCARNIAAPLLFPRTTINCKGGYPPPSFASSLNIENEI